MTGRSILFLDGPNEPELVFNGYEDDYAGMIALLVHLRDRFHALGQDVELFPSDATGEEDDQQDHQD